MCHATPKEDLKNKLIQSKPKKMIQEKTLTVSSLKAI